MQLMQLIKNTVLKLNALAANMLQSREDGLECVNDTYMKAWNNIPPARPEYLFAFLAASAKYCD